MHTSHCGEPVGEGHSLDSGCGAHRSGWRRIQDGAGVPQHQLSKGVCCWKCQKEVKRCGECWWYPVQVFTKGVPIPSCHAHLLWLLTAASLPRELPSAEWELPLPGGYPIALPPLYIGTVCRCRWVDTGAKGHCPCPSGGDKSVVPFMLPSSPWDKTKAGTTSLLNKIPRPALFSLFPFTRGHSPNSPRAPKFLSQALLLGSLTQSRYSHSGILLATRCCLSLCRGSVRWVASPGFYR